MPTLLRKSCSTGGGSDAKGTPSTSMEPVDGSVTLSRSDRSVDFQLPPGPTMHTASFGSTVNEISLNTLCDPKLLLTCFTEIMKHMVRESMHSNQLFRLYTGSRFASPIARGYRFERGPSLRKISSCRSPKSPGSAQRGGALSGQRNSRSAAPP